jgi:hypothetical protein
VTTTTPNLSLVLYNSTTDQAEYFSNFRATIAGVSTSSNFYKIDTAYGNQASQIASLEDTRGAIYVPATYVSANYYEANSITEITAYTTNMAIILRLDTASAGTVTLNINSLGTKTVSKINSSGSVVNIAAGELMVGKNYLFRYDGTQWIWVNPNSIDQLYAAGTSGNFLRVSSSNTVEDSGSSPSTFAVAAKGVTNGDSHDHSGGDGAAITEAAITLADNITNDVSTAKHGFTPKAPNDTSKFLRGDASWAVIPSASSDYLSVLTGAEVSITGTDTANWGYQHVVTGSTDFSITLQACSGHADEFMSFRILNTGVTTLDGNSAETIDGVTTRACYQGQTVTLYCDGSNAHVINQVAGQYNQWFSPLEFASNFTKKYTVRTSQPYNFAMEQNSGAANGDWISVTFFAQKGSYTCEVLGFTAVSVAKQDWTLNGVSQTTGQDWYSASTVYNVVKTFTLTVPYTGIHTLKSTINGRNASATGWDFQLTAIAIH